MFTNNDFRLLKNLVQSLGIHIHAYQPPFLNIEEFDNGLRKQIYSNYDYVEEVIEKLNTGFGSDSLCLVSDTFGVSYAIIVSESDATYIVVGPFLRENCIPDTKEIIKQNNLNTDHEKMLTQYYSSLPVTKDIDSLIYTFFDYFIKDTKISLKYLTLEFGEMYKELAIQKEPQNDLITEIIENRYKCENDLISAISHGDQTRAVLLLNELGKYRTGRIGIDDLRKDKNMFITLNVLFRKAVERVGVHPIHISEVSDSFLSRIETIQNSSEIANLLIEIINKYCYLVKNYSLKDYSELIVNVINYIEFQIQYPLNLKEIADFFNVNPSYLSGLFKKETGKTLTSYIIQKKIKKATILLSTTSLPIQEIAATVGIFDENYFSRLFKREEGISPRMYRSKIKQKLSY